MHRIRHYIHIAIICFGLSISYSQTEQDIIKEADRLQISSRQEAINALASRGISLAQAKEMAQLRGLDFDTFLENYLKKTTANTSVQSTMVSPSNEVVSTVKIADVKAIQAVAPKITKKDSVINYFGDVVPNPTKKDSVTNYFGYNIFINNPFGQKEYLVGNIDEGYILAPGDELRITAFGDNSLEVVSKIDLNGNISFPKLGVFSAAGNSLKTVTKRLQTYLGRYYSGLLTEPATTFLDVSLTQIRPVKVSVLGNVNTPGPHLVNGMATVLNALYASGGVSTSGTLRAVKVYRNNRLIKTIDLYDFITQGNLDKDIRLANNDVLFVGPRLSSVSLQGKVKKAAIYELKPNESLTDVLNFSGGLLPDASLKSINISRIQPFEDRTQELVFDRFLTTVNYAKLLKDTKRSFQLIDGDVVTVQSILGKEKNKVTIAGNVNAPGTYSLKTYNNLQSLITSAAKGILPKTYLEKVDVFREDEQGKLSFKTYNLTTVLTGDVAVRLHENDRIKIYSLAEVAGQQKVSISGFVKQPKTIFWRENLSLFDFIFSAVSFDEVAFQTNVLASRVDLLRFDENSGQYVKTQFSLDDITTLTTINLMPNDKVVLYSKNVTEDQTLTISVKGQVLNPGQFQLQKNMYVEDAILAAGGFTEFAEKTKVYLNTLNRNVLEGTYSSAITYTIDLEYVLGLKAQPDNPILLQNEDVISVAAPIRPKNQPVVQVFGEVNYPRPIIVENDKTGLQDVINAVGGLSNLAHLKSSFVVRDSLLLHVDLEKAFKKNTFSLFDGDQLTIGSKLSPVKTTGAILNPAVFQWKEGKKAKYYVKKSGGTAKRIERRYVKHANGESEKIGFLKNPAVYPGSEIIVIAKPEKTGDKGREFLDDLVKVFGVVSGALTTILLTTRL